MDESKGRKSFHLDDKLLKKGDGVFFTQSVSAKGKKKADKAPDGQSAIPSANSRIDNSQI